MELLALIALVWLLKWIGPAMLQLLKYLLAGVVLVAGLVTVSTFLLVLA